VRVCVCVRVCAFARAHVCVLCMHVYLHFVSLSAWRMWGSAIPQHPTGSSCSTKDKGQGQQQLQARDARTSTTMLTPLGCAGLKKLPTPGHKRLRVPCSLPAPAPHACAPRLHSRRSSPAVQPAALARPTCSPSILRTHAACCQTLSAPMACLLACAQGIKAPQPAQGLQELEKASQWVDVIHFYELATWRDQLFHTAAQNLHVYNTKPARICFARTTFKNWPCFINDAHKKMRWICNISPFVFSPCCYHVRMYPALYEYSHFRGVCVQWEPMVRVPVIRSNICSFILSMHSLAESWNRHFGKYLTLFIFF